MKPLSAEPLVSVVLNNFNYGRYLDAAIRSVLEQTYARVELIIVDDGSTDESRAVAERHAGRAVLVFKENGGQASALNAGVARAKGELVCFLDADDLWLPGKLDAVVRAFQLDPSIGWVRHKLAVVNEALEPQGAQIPEFAGSGVFAGGRYHYLERRATVSTSALCLRAEVCAAIFPIPERDEVGDAAGGGGGAQPVRLNFDADAYLTATMYVASVEGRLEGCRGYSLDLAAGLYRRHSGQQYKSTEDVLRMIERQAAVGEWVSREWSRRAGVRRVSLSVHRSRLVALTLRGSGRFSVARISLWLRGSAQGLLLAAGAPGLAVRQLLSLAYVFAMPSRWLRRVLGVQGFNLNQADSEP